MKSPERVCRDKCILFAGGRGFRAFSLDDIYMNMINDILDK